MMMKRGFLIVLLLCWPIVSVADDNGYNLGALINSISGSKTLDEANTNLDSAYETIKVKYNNKVQEKTIDKATKKINKAKSAPDGNSDDSSSTAKDPRTDEEKQKALAEKQAAYDEAKETEQSLENRMLGGLTMAATGIGGMELAQGLAEQKAAAAAEQDMSAYIATFRCTYGDGKQVKAGPDEIELPGGNDANMMKYRNEYMTLAADLKVRKEALEMKPGIESEEILDKSQMGLYDQENTGIESGAYASLYRAKMLGSEEDQAKLDEEAKKSKARVIGGATALGVGVVGGMVGNSLINGELGDLVKNGSAKSLKAAIKIETDALKDIKKCLKQAGAKNTDDLKFEHFYPSLLSTKDINCKKDLSKIDGKDADTIFADSDDAEDVFNKLVDSFGGKVAGKLIDVKINENPTDSQKDEAVKAIKDAFDKVEKRFADAAKEDSDSKSADNGSWSIKGVDVSSFVSQFSQEGGNTGVSGDIMNLTNNFISR